MIQLVGIPFDENASFLKGPARAPEVIRLMEKGGSANCFAEDGLEILPNSVYQDQGDIQFPSNGPAIAFETIRHHFHNIVKSGKKCIAFGGDHSVTWPVVRAVLDQHPGLHILHIDAHPDLYHDFENNPYSHASPFARIMETGLVKSLTQVGIRTFNTHQREQAKRFGVHVIEMKNYSPDFISNLQGPLYISFDMDGLDPAFAPGVSHHEPGGLTTRQALHIIQNIKVPIVGADIVEYNPDRDINHVTAMTAYKLFKEIAAAMVRNGN